MSAIYCDVETAFNFMPFCVYDPCLYPTMSTVPSAQAPRQRFLDSDPSLERPKRKASTFSLRKKPSTFGMKKKQSTMPLKPTKSPRVDSVRSDSSTGSTSESCSQTNSSESSVTPSSSISSPASRDDQGYSLLKYWFYHVQKKPYSAITVQIEHLTSEQYEEDDLSGIPDLIEVIRLQGTGPTEAARALRKKLSV